MSIAPADRTVEGSSDRGSGPFRLAVVGGGPRATYALERLAATVGGLGPHSRLDIRVFERTGEFGAGAVHSARQSRTSFLNRTSAQVGFAADETVRGAGPLRPPAQRPSLYEWCRQTFARTGDADFDLGSQDWPRRHVHGAALTDMFQRYVAELRAHPGVSVSLHDEEVLGVHEHGPALTVRTAHSTYPADQVLLVTGHSAHDVGRCALTVQRRDVAARVGVAYVPYPYPLDEQLPPRLAAPGQVVGCLGMGLTAIDVILHLTEGRGGVFEPGSGGSLRYRPSGSEPAAIVACGEAGLFTFARADNHKVTAELEHRGTFLTGNAIDRLRAHVGRPVAGRRLRQLDFDRHVLPIVVLEMAHVFYTTLFGHRTGRFLAARSRERYERFLVEGPAAGGDENTLTEPLEQAVDEIVAVLDAVLEGREPVARAATQITGWPVTGALSRWVRVVHGDAADELAEVLDQPAKLAAAYRGWQSPWRLDDAPAGNRFTWARTISPIDPRDRVDPRRYTAAVLDFMDRDQCWARQGNLDNPHKAAADGVWRDLRGVISYAVDDGGLTPASQRDFLARHTRHHNRLGNGAAREVMARITALIRHGVLDVGTGPGGSVRLAEHAGRVTFVGPVTGAEKSVDTLVQAYVHPFDTDRDRSPLFRDLAEQGLVRRWRNVGPDGDHFEPGGLDLTPRFHPIRRDGRPDPRLTIIGPAAEGNRSFLLSALRPGRDHYVMRDTLTWIEDFWAAHAAHADRPRAHAAAHGRHTQVEASIR